MREVSEAEKRNLLDEVCREFPDDRTMQEVHFARLLHRLQTEGMTSEERARFYAEAAGVART